MSGHGFHPFKGRVSRRFGDSLAPDEAYLSYYDVRLMREDVNCIKHDWLNDNVIAFWEEYLEREKLSAFPTARINLLRPSMVFLLNQTSDPLSLKEALPAFENSSHVFLPINDSNSPEVAEAGTHWSLLLVSIIDAVAFHYDSLHHSNSSYAMTACHKISLLLRRPLRFIELNDSPQQENGSDCGVFVCLEMQYLLVNRLLKRDSREQVTMSMRDPGVDAGKGRKEILRLIDSFRKEGKSRSRSRSPRQSFDSKSPPRIGD
ncbi:MAG: hypothetical protein M1828_000012 [Chrysothrix sp. TS-e1954]|nr:MAG: hypothetical protein M1828_000012 [Chrysothrix sp. TS-e1954]